MNDEYPWRLFSDGMLLKIQACQDSVGYGMEIRDIIGKELIRRYGSIEVLIEKLNREQNDHHPRSS